VEPERAWTLEALVAETRADVRHLQSDVTELRADLRADVGRLDARVDQLFLVQLATLATALGTLITALVNVLA
jgi:hypothetical protein